VLQWPMLSVPVKLTDYGFDLSKKYPTAMKAIRGILPDSYRSIDWIYDLSGTSAPLVRLIIDGKSFLGGEVCKPHDCGANNFTFLVAEDGSRAVAFVRADTIPGARNFTLGVPSSDEIAHLRQLEFSR
jgi:hypothetical protein